MLTPPGVASDRTRVATAAPTKSLAQISAPVVLATVTASVADDSDGFVRDCELLKAGGSPELALALPPLLFETNGPLEAGPSGERGAAIYSGRARLTRPDSGAAFR